MLQLNKNSLNAILRDFYTLTQIRIVLMDSDFNDLLAYPPDYSSFCAMIRQERTAYARCEASDKTACLKCAKTNELVLYRCHAGLTEAVVPIHGREGVMGYVMFGQVLQREGGEQTKQQLKKRYAPPVFAESEQIIDQIPVKSARELSAAGTILQALTAYLLSNSWVTPVKEAFIDQLDRYIDANVSCEITVEDICAEFHIRRTRLYEAASSYLGCGIAQYIRSRRINCAQRLLTQTELTVAEIAFATGFADYNHFSRVFRQQCGMSARTYRNENRT